MSNFLKELRQQNAIGNLALRGAASVAPAAKTRSEKMSSVPWPRDAEHGSPDDRCTKKPKQSTPVNQAAASTSVDEHVDNERKRLMAMSLKKLQQEATATGVVSTAIESCEDYIHVDDVKQALANLVLQTTLPFEKTTMIIWPEQWDEGIESQRHVVLRQQHLSYPLFFAQTPVEGLPYKASQGLTF